jgi:wobble nucleotide-excising tRNase
MIASISVADVASYGPTPQVLNDLSRFNYFYGSNGTGKTTISKVIADERAFPKCSVTWQGGLKQQTRVYNQDFVTNNFSQSAELKGIFTLGEKSIDIQNRIATEKADVDELATRIQQLTKTVQGDDGIGGKKGDLAALDADFKTTCWKQKQKHDPKLSGAFEGFRGSADKFKSKILAEQANAAGTVEPLADLEKKAATVFGPTPTQEIPVAALDAAALIALEADRILTKRIIGRTDVDIASVIQKLGSSDWVRAGRAFYNVNDKQCPFCQQGTPDTLARSLEEYFDETFERDTGAIERIATAYEASADRLRQRLDSIIAAPSRFLDVEKLKVAKELADSRIMLNLQRLAAKRKEPSQSIILEPLGTVISEASKLIDEANAQVASHNAIVANLARERRDLTAQVWRYLLAVELKDDLTAYAKESANLNAAITAISEKIASAAREKAEKETSIRGLEKETTSIQPTVDKINAILASFGFLRFSIAKARNGRDYKLVRPDGTDARATLSEGEKTFVTFLYFYYLLKGSDSETGMTTDRVVVFDDPVSSLDSDIAFIVSSLIRGLCDDVRAGRGYIKQIFVLTHNVYFHKEVTFNPTRSNVAMDEETFWMIRNAGLESIVEKHTGNPIKTSYELLWAEVRTPTRSNHTIQNTLRRILENYFKIFGGVDSAAICEMFEGKEKLICRSLFSWVHYGSHYVDDDLYVSIDDAVVETYLAVFRAIFDKSNHSAHYRMMMGDDYVAPAATSVATTAAAVAP